MRITWVCGAVAVLAPWCDAQTAPPPDSAPPAPAVLPAASYVADAVANVRGGARRASTYLDETGVQLTFDLARIARWSGATAYLFAMRTHGGMPTEIVGDLQGTSSLQAPSAVRIEEAWLQQNLLGNRLSLLVGRYDLNSEFYRAQSAALFLNSSFGLAPELAQSGWNGPSTFPRTSFGMRVAVKPSPNVVWRTLISPQHLPGGAPPTARGGALFASELAFLLRPGTATEPRNRRFRIGRGRRRPYSAKLAVGGWYYSGRFPAIADTISNGTPVMIDGARGAYLLGDLGLWRQHVLPPMDTASARTLSVFTQLGLGDGRVWQTARYVGGGITMIGTLPRRTNDELGLALACAQNGADWVQSVPTAAPSEITWELSYLAQLLGWLAVQPDVQYVIHPGATRALPRALVLAVRVELTH
jgi:porin